VRWIDTEETLPIFQHPKVEYTISKLEHVSWETIPEVVAMAARDKKMSHLEKLGTVTDLHNVLDLLITPGERHIYATYTLTC